MSRKLSEVKAHLQLQHYNLLDACMFCDHCSELFVNRQSLDKHMFVHVEQVFQCNNCKKKFLTEKELEDHSNKAQKCKPKSKLKKLHVCPFGCGESFVSAQLWKHKKKCKNGPEAKGAPPPAVLATPTETVVSTVTVEDGSVVTLTAQPISFDRVV